ncbi:MAG: AAA family ATPase [Nitrososphaerota archaeon]|jgi:predicted AAA+ superfamily ATPase|nr:AAA family ATPase [Nitrososphaerota archaeon]
MTYIKRTIDKEIAEKLEIMGCIVIRGPKWCGKTTTAKQFAKSVIELQDPHEEAKYKEIAENNIKLLLEGKNPRLIDEWQLIPNIWNAIKHDVDKKDGNGLYIITGSVAPNDKDKKDLHSGIGRMSFVTMYPMSLYESGDSNGSISLKDILSNKVKVNGQTSNITYERLAYLTCRGGWPSAVKMKDENKALRVAKEYLDALCETDIENDLKKNINPALTRAIIRAYSRLICTIEADKTLYEDVRSIYGAVSDPTIMSYLNKLKRLYVSDEIEAWNPNIISKTNVRTSPKKALVDSSIACAALQCSPKELALDPLSFGRFFENLVDRDLKIYASSIGGYLRHYRDRYGLECDQVIHFDNSEYGLIQTKLGTRKIKEGAEKLIDLRDKIKVTGKKEPKFLMVVTGSDIAYTTKEGVLIVPIGCLKD